MSNVTNDKPVYSVAEEIDFYRDRDFNAQTLIEIAWKEIAQGEEMACTSSVAILRDQYARAIGLLAALIERIEEDGGRS